MFEPEDLLQPLPGPDPCGPDLSYDPEFLQLEAAARGSEEQRMGHAVRPAVPPDWPAVRRLALSLFERTRDLRVAMHLLRAEFHLEGAGALARGLRLAAGLLERYATAVHPRPDAEEWDSAERIAALALAPIDRAGTVLADVLALRFGDPDLGVTGRDIARALRGPPQHAAEPARSIDEMLEALRDEVRRSPGLIDQLEDAAAALRDIDNLLGFELADLGVRRRYGASPWDGDPEALGMGISLLMDAARQAVTQDRPPASDEAHAPRAAPADSPAPSQVARPVASADALAHPLPTDLARNADVAGLLAPVTEEEPCGPNLEYDSAYLELEIAAHPARQHALGDAPVGAEQPDWPVIARQARALLARTRDLRVAVHLLRALTRLAGIDGAASGLRLIAALLAQWWDCVHPALDPEDDNDPWLRLNALAPLGHPDAFLRDLREIEFGSAPVAGRSIELSHRGVTPGAAETLVAEPATRQALQEEARRFPGLLGRAQEARQAALWIEATIAARCPGADGTLQPLVELLGRMVEVMERALEPGETVAGDEAPGSQPRRARAAQAPATGPTREEAMHTLEALCAWIDRNCDDPARECRQASRLMARRFEGVAGKLAPGSELAIEDFLGGSRR